MTFNRQDKYPYRKSFKLKSAQGARMDSITSKEKFNRNSLYLILGFSLFELLLHLYTNAFAGYGYFRDELYYTACSNHLAAGYVDQPPLSAYILFLSIKILGKSIFALRLLPAIVSAVIVFITGIITRRLNGRYTALTLACLAVALAPIFLGTGTFYSMNIFDWLFWVLAYYIVVLIINSSQTGIEVDKKLWVWLGIVLGLGLLNKISLLWFGAGLLIGLILTPQRKYLRTPWPYFTGIIAFVIFSPYIIWNITHNFATLEFIHNASALKYSSQNPGTFINDTFQSLNPVSSILWIAGIFFLFFHRGKKIVKKVTTDKAKRKILTSIFLLSFLVFNSQLEIIAQTSGILTDAYADVNGAKLWYEMKGSGDPIVLIPGGPGNSHLYLTPWFDKLAKNHKVIFYDALGRGNSGRAKDSTEYSFKRDVEDLEGLRKTLGFDNGLSSDIHTAEWSHRLMRWNIQIQLISLSYPIHFTAVKCGREMMITQIMKLKISIRKFGVNWRSLEMKDLIQAHRNTKPLTVSHRDCYIFMMPRMQIK